MVIDLLNSRASDLIAALTRIVTEHGDLWLCVGPPGNRHSLKYTEVVSDEMAILHTDE